MKKTIQFALLSVFLCTITSVSAAAVTRTYNFDPPSINTIEGNTVVTMNDCWTVGDVGAPALPVYGGCLLLPPGTASSAITIHTSELISLGNGYQIEPVQAQYPLSLPGPHPLTPADDAIYRQDGFYPQVLADTPNTQYRRGYSLGYIALHPVVYNPVSGEIAWYSSITVTIETGTTPAALQAFNLMFRASAKDEYELLPQLDNPENLAVYPAGINDTRDETVEYLIVTDEDLHASFTELANYKNARGMETEVVLVSWIVANYDGFDTPDKIRNCITDYYQNYGTEYVLMAGDNENVPKRSLYGQMGGTIDPDIASDNYYGCLDGNFNADGDQYMGEPNDDPDLVGEVYVGRAGVDCPEEAQNFIAKQIGYQHTPVADEVTQGLMLGEDLEWLVWGSAYKEEIRLGASTWGYTTEGFPNWFAVDTLYDYPGYYWSAMGDLIPRLNEGPQLVNHLGHANNTYTLKIGSGDINDNNCTNNGVNHNYYIIFSQGCYCNSWDNRTPDFWVTGNDAISEIWTSIENGAVAFIGNTRYGWGNYSSTNGASQYGDRQFFDAIFGENITDIGRALQDSKEDCIPFLNNVTYYCYYQCGLMGDPSLKIWTEIPEPISVICSPVIDLGDTTFTLEVEGLTDAICAISQNGQLLGSTNSGTLGTITINLSEPVQTVDPVRLIVTKDNYLPFDLYLDVYVPNAPNLIYESVVVDDAAFDDDGIADLGESPYLDLIITNFGGVDASNVTAEIAGSDYYLTILDGQAVLGALNHDETLIFTSAFQIEIAPDVPDEHTAVFDLQLEDASGNTWQDQISLPIAAPDIMLSMVEIDDGNNQRLDPGESADLSITLVNTGTAESRNVIASIHTDSPYLEIIQDTGSAAILENGIGVVFAPAYEIIAGDDCPLSANIPVYVDIIDEMGYYRTTLFEIVIGGLFETFETGAQGWTHETAAAGWEDQWCLTDNRNYTLNGTTSWHCGPADGSNYTDNLNAGLLSPVYDILPGATLTFRHWMEAEVSQSNPGNSYDGGVIEMSLDGSAFMQLYPVGGYNSYIRDYPPDMGPFVAHFQVFSGNIFWEEVVVDLDIFPDGQGVFRFRFGSNSTGAREGWYVDDVEVTYYSPVTPPANFTGGWLDPLTVRLDWNSPGIDPPEGSGKGENGDRETEALMCYRVYRNGEMIADDVQALFYEDALSSFAPNTFSYTVTALYNKGESDPAGPLEFVYTSVENGADNLIPDEFFADQNYPNPFNPVTSIRYGLPEASNVRIAVFDILGRQTAVLADSYLEPGYYTAVWNADTVPSGIYFYRVTAGSFNTTGKMLLLK